MSRAEWPCDNWIAYDDEGRGAGGARRFRSYAVPTDGHGQPTELSPNLEDFKSGISKRGARAFGCPSLSTRPGAQLSLVGLLYLHGEGAAIFEATAGTHTARLRDDTRSPDASAHPCPSVVDVGRVWLQLEARATECMPALHRGRQRRSMRKLGSLRGEREGERIEFLPTVFRVDNALV
uniref:Uncharacterized protein n=1 Tax=Trichuris muris TaxID=70415 RepID=A0A5S6QEL6_TRIMR